MRIQMPTLHQIANLWSLRDYPRTDAPWDIDAQLDAIKSAGFDGVTGQIGSGDGKRIKDREIFVVPEMGPTSSGYNLSGLPNSWEEAITLRPLLEKIWYETLRNRNG
jgi:hypothetical protein